MSTILVPREVELLARTNRGLLRSLLLVTAERDSLKSELTRLLLAEALKDSQRRCLS